MGMGDMAKRASWLATRRSSAPRVTLLQILSIELGSPPSQLPLATVVKDSKGFARTSTASICPSRLSTKGFEKILSSLAALSARVRSLAFAKGCMLGLRLR